MKKLKVVLIIATSILLVSCGGSTKVQPTSNGLEDNTPLGQAGVVDETSDPNILQVAIGSKDHSTLVAAVQAARIEHVLVNAGPLTVFAPVNSALLPTRLHLPKVLLTLNEAHAASNMAGPTITKYIGSKIMAES